MNGKTYLVSISLDEDDQKKLEEYIKRSNKTKKQILEEAISEYLGCRIDDSFEGWYEYYRQDDVEPERAEELAHYDSMAKNFVPGKKKDWSEIPF